MTDAMKETIHDDLVRRFAQFQETPPPRGFASACEDLDLDLFEYNDMVTGLVSTYLRHGLDFESINDAKSIVSGYGQELDRRLNECERKLHELRIHTNIVSELAVLLAKCIDTET